MSVLIPFLVTEAVKIFTKSPEVIQVAQDNAMVIAAGSSVASGFIIESIMRIIPTKKKLSFISILRKTVKVFRFMADFIDAGLEKIDSKLPNRVKK